MDDVVLPLLQIYVLPPDAVKVTAVAVQITVFVAVTERVPIVPNSQRSLYITKGELPDEPPETYALFPITNEAASPRAAPPNAVMAVQELATGSYFQKS